jgi:hypothetical protein
MRRTLALAATTLFASLATGPAVQADYDPLGSGTTKLSFDKGFLSFHRQHGVTLAAKAPAKLKAGTLALPIAGGEMDPTIGKGTIDQSGVLLFKKGKQSLPLKRLTVKTKRTPLQAKVGGSQLKIAQGAKVSAKRAGFGTSFTATGLELTAKVATRLNKKLHLGKAFEEGQPIGKLKSNAQPETVTILAKNRATLVPDPGFVSKLDNLFVSLNPISPAELSPGPVFSFPIALGGELAPSASLGTLRTGGSIEFLQQGAGQIFQHEFWLDLGTSSASAEVEIQPTPTYPGKLGRIGVLAIGMAAGQVSSNPKARTISVGGAPLTLGAQTAATFDEVFAEKKGVFKAGDPFGAFSFTAQGQ